MRSLVRILKALVFSLFIAAISVVPLLLFHVFAPIFAPFIGGYVAGEHYALSAKEAATLGAVLMLIIGLPAPIAHHYFGAFPYLSNLAIDFLSVVGAIYLGGLVGLLSWWGGTHGTREIELGPPIRFCVLNSIISE